MRSFFCDKCNLEFDVDMDADSDEQDLEESTFCPQCKINLARILPETPERIIMREKRLKIAQTIQRKKDLRFLFLLNILFFAGLWIIIRKPGDHLLMLTAGLCWGFLTGLITRKITFDRSIRAGFLSFGTLLLMLGIAYCCRKFLYTGCFFVSIWGGIPAILTAIYDRDSDK